ncbi:uncharacterized protein [Spinacia oleracea]|uniref:Tryptophan synthase beta chain-like PALP domain-containing protein n=1 Tax=Spinacia oleracea TaxID=3562 RepID=A0A9R0I2E5_SPIOL|nr:uncharacterized protein LOC110780164 [Spinacia oleracea]
MKTWGAKVHPSPSELTEAGRRILQSDPLSPGSLGITIKEAVEAVIGEECIKQMTTFGETPDVIIGCTGGGCNFGELCFPFIREKLIGKMNLLKRSIEPTACPSLAKGVFSYGSGDPTGMTPLLKMHTLGHDFIPDPIHAGGLLYHGMTPLISHAYELGLMEAVAILQTECFQAYVSKTKKTMHCKYSSHERKFIWYN